MENKTEYSKPVVRFEQRKGRNVCVRERGGGWACIINDEIMYFGDLVEVVRTLYPEAEKIEVLPEAVCVTLNGKEYCFSDVEAKLGKLLDILEKKASTVYSDDDWESDVLAMWHLFKAAPEARYIVVRDGNFGRVVAYDTAAGLIFAANVEDHDEVDEIEVPSALTAAAVRGTVYRARAADYVVYAIV
jgi:hypothetical protein